MGFLFFDVNVKTSNTPGGPRLSFTGRDRQAIKRLRAALKAAQDMDLRRSSLAVLRGVSPVLLASGPLLDALDLLYSRCDDALAQRD